ncbi:MAG: DUF2726 domain-containing protein [Pseudomonadota bacterium]
MNFSTILMMVLMLLIGAALGGGLYAWWQHKQETSEPPLPAKWPLTARVLMTVEEYEVMVWLRRTFPKHLIMIKLPVVRFTIPIKEKGGRNKKWQKMLEGVNCTFSICTSNGSVVGCVDVPGKRGLPRGNRDLKDGLLSDCGIAYTVVRGSELPKSSAMRAAFLGEANVEDQQEHQETRGGDSVFHADLDAFTARARQVAKEAALKELNKDSDAKRLPKVAAPAGFNPDGTGSFGSLKPPRFPVDWEDSFIAPTGDSRPGKLE